MPQEVRYRKQQTIDFETNNKVSVSLSRGMVYRELYLKLYGQLDADAADNDQANLEWGDEWGVVKRIDLIANNTDVIRSFSGNALWWMNFFMFGTPPRVTPALGDGATANPAFAPVLILPLWSPGSIRPIDTALDARQLSDLKLEITWGTYTDIDGDADGWTVEPKIDVYSLESFNVRGPFSQARIYTIEREITATNTQFQIQLPVGPMYRGFFLNFTDAGVDDGDVLNNFKIKAGSTVYADLREEILQDMQLIRRHLNQVFDGTTTEAYLPLRRGTTYNSINGWYFYDHVTDGYQSEAIDTLGFSEFELELDVTIGGGTTKIFVMPWQIYPVRGKAK